MPERETETIECRRCGTPFNLAAQWYYDNLCPSCKADDGDETDTWPSCYMCQDRVDPDDVRTHFVSTRGGPPESVPVCPDCA